MNESSFLEDELIDINLVSDNKDTWLLVLPDEVPEDKTNNLWDDHIDNLAHLRGSPVAATYNEDCVKYLGEEFKKPCFNGMHNGGDSGQSSIIDIENYNSSVLDLDLNMTVRSLRKDLKMTPLGSKPKSLLNATFTQNTYKCERKLLKKYDQCSTPPVIGEVSINRQTNHHNNNDVADGSKLMNVSYIVKSPLKLRSSALEEIITPADSSHYKLFNQSENSFKKISISDAPETFISPIECEAQNINLRSRESISIPVAGHSTPDSDKKCGLTRSPTPVRRMKLPSNYSPNKNNLAYKIQPNAKSSPNKSYSLDFDDRSERATDGFSKASSECREYPKPNEKRGHGHRREFNTNGEDLRSLPNKSFSLDVDDRSECATDGFAKASSERREYPKPNEKRGHGHRREFNTNGKNLRSLPNNSFSLDVDDLSDGLSPEAYSSNNEVKRYSAEFERETQMLRRELSTSRNGTNEVKNVNGNRIVMSPRKISYASSTDSALSSSSSEGMTARLRPEGNGLKPPSNIRERDNQRISQIHSTNRTPRRALPPNSVKYANCAKAIQAVSGDNLQGGMIDRNKRELRSDATKNDSNGQDKRRDTSKVSFIPRLRSVSRPRSGKEEPMSQEERRNPCIV